MNSIATELEEVQLMDLSDDTLERCVFSSASAADTIQVCSWVGGILVNC